MIRLSNTLSSSEIYGPGKRYVIWVQGCSLECPGCWNKELWSDEGGYLANVEDLILDISSTDGIEGITILGGEPLEQSASVFEIIKSSRDLGLTVMLYTGYEIHELNNSQLDCLNSSDIVIMGRYVASLRDTKLRWRGSSNQKIEILSEIYRGLEIEEREEVEITIDPDGKISMAGYPKRWLLKVLEEL